MSKEIEMLRIFLVAAESSSFRDAAVKLATSPQAVTRAIKHLEAHYGELLFHRNTRQIRITTFGEGLLDQVRDALEQVEDLLRVPGEDQGEEVSGMVRITAPHSLCNRAILPAIESVAERHPCITMDVRLSDRISNTVDEGIDVGVRVGFMRDSRYVARKAADMRLPVVAAPGLIEKLGAPNDIDALVSLPILAALNINTGRPWPWYFKGERQWVPASPVLIADNAEVEMGAALSGLGFAQLADYMAAPYIASGELVQVLENEEPPPWGLFVYRPQSGPVPQRVRAVFDAVHATLGAMPSLNQLD